MLIEIRDTKKLLKYSLAILLFAIIFDNVTTYIALSSSTDISETNCYVDRSIKEYGLLNGLIYSEVMMLIGYGLAILSSSILFWLMVSMVIDMNKWDSMRLFVAFGTTYLGLMKIGVGIVNIINTAAAMGFKLL